MGSPRVPSRQMLPRHGAPLAPHHVARRGPPKPVFLAQLSQRSVGKSSPHEVIHMEHHICRIFILTRVKASSGCRQSLCLTDRQLQWAFHPGRWRGGQRAGRAATPGVGGRPGDPGHTPGAPGSPPAALRGGGLAVPVSPAAPMQEQLLNSCVFCAVSARGQRVETT